MKVVTVVCWLITASVLAGLVLWFLTGTVFGVKFANLGPDWSFGFNIGNIEALTGPYKTAGTYEVSTEGINSLNIDWVAGNVTVRPYEGAEIKIIEYAQRDLSDNETLRYSTSGGKLTIRFRESGLTGKMPQKKLEVFIPRALCEDLHDFTIDSASGGIDVESIVATAIKVDSTSGSISAVNITARTFSANSTSGSISLNNIQADNLKADCTSGSITVTSAKAVDMEIDSMSGRIRVSDSSAGKITVDTTSGSVNVSGAFDDAKLNSISGRIAIDNSAENSILDANTTSGSLDLTGAFDRVDADSISGSIEIRSSIIPSSVKVDSTSGSITIAVPNTGSISVHHSSTSGRFSSDIPVVMQGRGAQFDLSTISGSARIIAINN